MNWHSLSENRLLLAFLTAALGFVFALVLERVKRRRDPRKEISWDVLVEKGPDFGRRDSHQRLAISFDNVRVENLVQIFLRIENTGNSVIKEQRIRFKYPDDAKVLDMFLDPEPELELGVVPDQDPALGPGNRRYKIGHLEVGQTVGFRIVADGGSWLGWSDIHPHNEEGGVRFEKRDVARQKADEEEIVPFIQSAVAFALALAFMSVVPLGWLLLLVAVPLGVQLMLKAPAIARVMNRALARKASAYQVSVNGGSGISVGEANTQYNTYDAPRA